MSVKLGDIFDKHFSKVEKNDAFTLMAGSHRSLTYIKDVAYISPDFKIIYEADESAKFIVFSAPGATGKSALAKYISKEYKCIYWDSSKIALGEKTLQGSLIDAIGDEKYGEYKKKLQNGKTLLIIDALDEAEIISGRKNLTFLLNDLQELKNGYRDLSFVLLARTDTASYIYNVIKKRNDNIAYYEIEYFSIEKAKEFIKFQIRSRKDIKTKSEKTINEYIDMQFNNIKELLPKKAINAFLGYAPVLETISAAFGIERNVLKTINSLKLPQYNARSVDIIDGILNKLLQREHEKVIAALQDKWKNNIISNWDNVYDIEEQLILILQYLIFGEFDKEYIKNDDIKESLFSEYEDVIKIFLPQHPFIREYDNDYRKCDFAGVAFRDFTIAFLQKTNKCNEYINEYLDDKQEDVSTLYYDFIKKYNTGALVNDVFMQIYRSFISKNSSEYLTYVEILQDNKDNDFEVIFKYNDSNKYILDWETTILGKQNELNFTRIQNTYINIKTDISLNGKKASKIVNSMIFCENINVDIEELSIESTNDAKTYIQCNGNLYIPNNGKNINVFSSGNGNIKIYAKNIYQLFKLKPYIGNLVAEDILNKDSISVSVYNILKYFRQHGKDTPAKDKEYIDNRIVGHSKLKKKILEFLIIKRIVYVDHAEKHLYKLNIEKARKYGIQWHSFDNVNEDFYTDFSNET